MNALRIVKILAMIAATMVLNSVICFAESPEVALNGACDVGSFSRDTNHVYCGTRTENAKYSAIDGSKIESIPSTAQTITTTIESLDRKHIYQRETVWSWGGSADYSHWFIFEEKASLFDQQGNAIRLSGKAILLPIPDAVASKKGLVGSCNANSSLCEWNRATGQVNQLSMPVPIAGHTQIYSNAKYIVAYGARSEAGQPTREWLSIVDMNTEQVKVIVLPTGVTTGWNARMAATADAQTIIIAQASTYKEVINENCDPFEDRTRIYKYAIKAKVKTLVSEVCGNALDVRMKANQIRLLMIRHTDRRQPNAAGRPVVTTLNL